jgi:multiple sugar transport system permease protein
MTLTQTTNLPRRAGEGDGAARRNPVKHKGAIIGFLAPFALLFAVFYLLPVFYALYQSFFTIRRHGAFGPPINVFGGLSQYQRVFHDTDFWTSILRVIAFFFAQVPIMLGLALVFALLLDSPSVKGKKFFRISFFAPYAVPGVIAAIMWGFLYAPNLSPFPLASHINFLGPGLVLFAIANVVTWVYCGYNMLVIYSALQAISHEIYEAARMDGAGQFRIAWSIKIPIVLPAIILTGVFSIIGTLQLFNEPTVFRSLTSAVSNVYTPNMVVLATANVPNYNLAAAFSVVLALATFALSFLFLRITQRRAFA